MKKIMIIDDEPDIRAYLMAALEDNGYQTCTMQESEPVLDTVMAHNPDLIILDIMMPRRSGISIYKELRASVQFEKIPIALISAISPAKDLMEGGFRKLIDDSTIPLPDGFIEKPVKLTTLMKLVEKLLE